MPKEPKPKSPVKSERATSRCSSGRVVYPFTAIVGQEAMKLALILSAIEPNIGGVIIMGHRGTGKSTAVRALADLLPPIKKVKGCIYGCDPDRTNELCTQCTTTMSDAGQLPAERGMVPVVVHQLGATVVRICG